MSGLFAGLQLRARGFAVDISKRVDSELSGRGAGIVAQPGGAGTMRGARHRHLLADLGVEMKRPGKSPTPKAVSVVEAHCAADADAWSDSTAFCAMPFRPHLPSRQSA